MRASYLGSHPIEDLIHSAVDLFDHFNSDNGPVPAENAVWDSCIADEPGGIALRVVPREAETIWVSVFEYREEFCPTPEAFPDIEPVAEGLVEFWVFAEAVAECAARAVVAQGMTGLWEAFYLRNSDLDSHFPVLPYERFLYLTAMVKCRARPSAMSFDEELRLLGELKGRYGKRGSSKTG